MRAVSIPAILTSALGLLTTWPRYPGRRRRRRRLKLRRGAEEDRIPTPIDPMSAILTLQSLQSDEYARKMGASTTGSVRQLILETAEFADLREALHSGELSESTIERFLNDIFATFAPGKHFVWEPALATPAVLLETHSSDFADKYLSDLANSPFVEFSMASRMGAFCKKSRSEPLTQPKLILATPSTRIGTPSVWGLTALEQIGSARHNNLLPLYRRARRRQVCQAFHGTVYHDLVAGGNRQVRPRQRMGLAVGRRDGEHAHLEACLEVRHTRPGQSRYWPGP